MTRVSLPTRDEAPEGSHEILDSFQKSIGKIPNVFRLLSLSPNALVGVVGLQQSLGKTLTMRTRHIISLAVSQVNGCRYCLSAHTFFSTLQKVDPKDIELARRGMALDPKENAVAVFAKKVTELRGKVSAEDVQAVKAAGFTDAQVVEIICVAAQFLLTNFLNNALDPEIDFPAVDVELSA